ncbi:MAG TPA: hypothetical protein VGS41_09610, partial [Chthonomonadales bacterium]|nr:hypothetical protein [Chthonomonadales bacterium]
LLRKDGVRFLNNRVQTFTRLERKQYSRALHAEGEWETGDGKTAAVDVFIGPQYGAVNSAMVEDAIRAARRADVLVFAAFNYDAAAQAVIQETIDPRLQLIRADIDKTANPAMGGLLDTTAHQQLFTVSGLPRTKLEQQENGEYTVTMEGVDIYDPTINAVRSAGADKVAAWFLDSDYDNRTFCITQAFFPDKSAWENIARHLDRAGAIDSERFEAFSGTTSLPFPIGKNRRIAVKVIDPRGSEVIKVHRFGEYEP